MSIDINKIVSELTYNGTPLILPAGNGGDYNIKSTDNEDGTQNLEIIDADGSGSGDNSGFIHAIQRDVEDLVLPEGLTSIGGEVFRGWLELKSIVIPEGVESIGGYCFYCDYPYDETAPCSALSSVTLPSTLVFIGDSAFANAVNLSSISLPENLTTLKSYAFSCCSMLAINALPASVTTIDSGAFYGCTGITEMTFKGTPTTIKNNVFQGCNNLTTINVPWAEGAVANAPWGATKATINYNYVGE